MERPIPFIEAVGHIKRFADSLNYVANKFDEEAGNLSYYKSEYERIRKDKEQLDGWYKELREKSDSLKSRVAELEADNDRLKNIVIQCIDEKSSEVAKNVYTEQLEELKRQRDEARNYAQKYRDEYEGRLNANTVLAGEFDLPWENDEE